MKIGTLLSLTFAAAGLFLMASPAEAQHRGGGGHGGSGHSSGSFANHGNYHRGGGDFHHGGNWNHSGNWHHGYYRGHSNAGFYFGGFGYPSYYAGGYPYYGYGYGYGYAPYGYGYYSAPVASYTYDPQGVYTGRVVSRRGGQLSVAAQVQQQLAQAGYYHGDIDGIIGQGTRRAIRSYERANGLHVDGEIDNDLLATMGLG